MYVVTPDRQQSRADEKGYKDSQLNEGLTILAVSFSSVSIGNIP